MRRLAVLLLVMWMTLPALAARKVTVSELKQTLQSTRGYSDGHLARRLHGLELTERLGGLELAQLERVLPGAKSRTALLLLADLSAFLDPAALPDKTASKPEMDAQLQMLSLCVEYVKSVLPRLPNFTATRETRHYLEVRPVGPNGQESMIPYDPLHATGDSQETLQYSHGAEMVSAAKTKLSGDGPAPTELTTRGVFGPMLGVVIADALRGTMTWSHWEESVDGPAAVFRFVVPKARSHYEVQFCCLRFGLAPNSGFREYASYHGEVAMDPITGCVLRLIIMADMDPSAPIRKSSILVEYGPVSAGSGAVYCPVRSVSLQVESERGTGFVETSLNDVTFSGYHMFGSESRVMTGSEGETP